MAANAPVHRRGLAQKYYGSLGVEQEEDFEAERDSWSDMRARTVKPWDSWFGVKTSSSTRFIEALKGLPREESKARYLEHDGTVFHFLLLHESQEGVVRHRVKYWLYFYMATREVEVHEEKGQKDYATRLKLLRRQRLPKGLHLLQDSRPRSCDRFDYEADYYNELDLVVGTTINIMGREMLVCDCDDATQAWYRDNVGVDQKAGAIDVAALLGEDAPRGRAAAPARRVPRLLRESPVRQPPAKFDGRLDSDHPIERTREFVILFHHDTKELAVYETEIRNSGIVGGPFLRRSRQVNVATGAPFELVDFNAGMVVINHHRFHVIPQPIKPRSPSPGATGTGAGGTSARPASPTRHAGGSAGM